MRNSNGIWEQEDHESEDEGGGSPGIIENKKTLNIVMKKTKTQNGSVGNSVIARSKDFILLPDPDAQNQKNNVANSKTGHLTQDVGNEKQVNFIVC